MSLSNREEEERRRKVEKEAAKAKSQPGFSRKTIGAASAEDNFRGEAGTKCVMLTKCGH